MKCEQVKILLADYLDKKLPDGDRAMVQEHLRQCADCREELQFLKKYMKEIESFPSLKAPDDFLEKIHERINRPMHSGVIQKLFLPLRIKVPLEAAALLALALTGLIIFKPFKHADVEFKAEEPIASTDEKTEKSGQAERHIFRRDRSPMIAKEDIKIREKEKDMDLVPGKKVASANSEDMTVDNSAISEKSSKADKKAYPADRAEITLYLKQNMVSGGETQSRDSIAAQKSEQAEETKTISEKYFAAKKEKAGAERSSQTAPAGPYQAQVDTISSLAQSLEGRIIKNEYDDRTASNRLVVVEIPAKNYTRFMNGLRGSWSVQRQYPAMPPRRAVKVQINMNLQN
jgi:hypothetical protein